MAPPLMWGTRGNLLRSLQTASADSYFFVAEHSFLNRGFPTMLFGSPKRCSSIFILLDDGRMVLLSVTLCSAKPV